MRARGRPGSALRQSIVAGLVLALLALVAGVAITFTQHRSWTAESVLVVLPAADLDDASSAAYYETMSRGQIVATFAEVAGNLRFQQQAEDQLKLDALQRATVSTEVSVVPDTSVILVRATADNAAQSEQVADAMTAISSAYLGGLAKPFRTEMVHSAEGSAYSSSSSPLLLLAATVIVALIAGLAVQQAVYHLLVAMRGPAAGVRRGRDGGAAARPGEPEAPQASADEPRAEEYEATGAAPSRWGWW